MELFNIGFVTVRLVDFIDISIVTFLFYNLYEWLRGSLAIRILGAILLVFLFWKLVAMLDMVLLSSILGQFLGVGAIAIIIIFAAEIRRFLLLLGKNTILDRAWRQYSISMTGGAENEVLDKLGEGVEYLRNQKLGALLVLTGTDNLARIVETGDIIGAEISPRLLFSIFLSNSPLHDGAVIIDNNQIAAARCILPISDNPDLPPELGLRHRAGLGISETTDALVIIVSEETNEISIASEGRLQRDIDVITLENRIRKHYEV